ncbi:unnamed protein product, partial [Prorocentrum cordatum]
RAVLLRAGAGAARRPPRPPQMAMAPYGLARRLENLSLRFPNDKSELAFVAGRARQSLRNCAVASAIVQALAIIALVQDGGRSLDHECEAVRAVYQMKVVVIVVFAIPSLAICLGLYEKLGAVGSERLVSTMCVVACLAVILSNPYYVSLLHGSVSSSPVGLDGQPLRSDVETALTCLMLDGVLTVSHLYLQVRWHYLLAADSTVLLAIACGSANFMNDESHSVEKWFLLTLSMLALLSIVGARNNEATQRKLFQALLLERNGRVATEFKLEQALSSSSTCMDPETRSHVSLISSKASDQVFDLARLQGTDEDDDVLAFECKTALRSVAAVGKRQRWLVDTEHVRLTTKILGSGSFGLVVQGDFVGTPVAVKIPSGEVSTRSFVNLGNELGIMRHLRHPNIVGFHGACIQPDSGRMALILELVRGRTVDQLVCDPENPLRELARAQVLSGVCCALRYLHSRAPPVVHGDLKGSNVLAEQDAQGNLKPTLLDFGLSRRLRGSVLPPGGTLQYMAPEVLHSSPLDCLSDVFSLGRLVFLVQSVAPCRCSACPRSRCASGPAATRRTWRGRRRWSAPPSGPRARVSSRSTPQSGHPCSRRTGCCTTVSPGCLGRTLPSRSSIMPPLQGSPAPSRGTTRTHGS